MAIANRKNWKVLATAFIALGLGAVALGRWLWRHHDLSSGDCLKSLTEGLRPISKNRENRFLGKAPEQTASCRGGEKAVEFLSTPWVDWQNYWGTGDATSKGRPGTGEDLRGVDGALVDLEYQRIELIKFNLFDNNKTYAQYVRGRDGLPGPSLKVWPQMRLPKDHPNYEDVGGDGEQVCKGELIRFRTITGICNDIRNPLMGSTHQLFGRLVEFEATFPDLGKNKLARNRHDGRLGLLQPDPQVISRRLFTRAQRHPEKCLAGLGLEGESKDAECDYKKANTLNVLAAFWIQFMTHDWFSHLEEGHNSSEMIKTGCLTEQAGNAVRKLSAEAGKALGCRPDDRIDAAYISEQSEPQTFESGGKTHLARAYKTTRNNVTAWWDASQMYGYDSISQTRVKRDPLDRAKLLLVGTEESGAGYLPLFGPGDPINAEWAGQEATAFPDNWNIGLSFFHNVFAREHNAFVNAFRTQAALTPDVDCGLRDPNRPDWVVRYRDVTPDELFEIARLVVAAEIAKIHTIEWTPQLLYDEPLYLAMNANWNGLAGGDQRLTTVLQSIVRLFGESEDVKKANQWYSVFASGPGIFGLGSSVYTNDGISALFGLRRKDTWDIRNPDHINRGTNHFGSPFNFPEEFVTVYRLHPLVPDLVEFRELAALDTIRRKIPVVATFRGLATRRIRSGGMANWALSMGRQRAGALSLQNEPQFLQNLPMPRLKSRTDRLDVAALDLLRDRERGIPRFNEFRRQLGLRYLTGFDDFIDRRLPAGSPDRTAQEALVRTLREVYGQHTCDASKIITTTQENADGSPIDDCLNHANKSLVDNIEDLDTVVGWLAESTRPHGFAISETQFQVFILNASRRLFSDRFLTSSFRPEFYTGLGVRWVNDNGPDGKLMEKQSANGHPQEVSPLKRVLIRTIPTLAPELEHVTNIFDPWARERGEYYSLQWKPRRGAEADESFPH